MKKTLVILALYIPACMFTLLAMYPANNHKIEKPRFSEGKSKLDKLLNEHLSASGFNYLQALKIKFYIDEKGKLTGAETLDEKDEFSNKVEKYMQLLPGWTSGKIDGKPVGMYDTLTLVYGTVYPSYDIFMKPPLRKIVNEEEYKNYLSLYKNPDTHVFVLAIEKLPEFIGGYNYLVKYLNDSLIYPAEEKSKGTDGIVIVRFLVGEDGKISNASIGKSLSPACDKEALRLVTSMPRWVAGVRLGKPVAMYFELPIIFSPD